MTRHDTDVGAGEFDSIHWLFETVLDEPDPQDVDPGLPVDSAMVYGNEDSPERIEFYSLESPLITDTPVRVWTQPEPTNVYSRREHRPS
jgi:hypothetical protein